MSKADSFLPAPVGVDVWIVTLGNASVVHGEKLTRNDDQVRYRQIIPPRKKRNFVFRRTTLDFVLKRYVDKYTLLRSASGKPYVQPDGQKQPIYFNASTSSNICAIGVSKAAIGIDIESRDVKVDLIGICERFVPGFSSKKHRWLKMQQGNQIAMAAWCCFESRIKLRSLALHDALLESGRSISDWTDGYRCSNVVISDSNYVCAISQAHSFDIDHIYAMQYEGLFHGCH